MAFPQEQLGQGASLTASNNNQIRSDIADRVSSLGEVVINTGDNLSEDKLKDNSFLLLAGHHEGLTITVEGTTISGQPGTQLTRLVTCSGTPQYLNSLHFVSADNSNNLARLLNLSSKTGVYRIVGCRFSKQKNHTAQHVQLASGAKVIFVNCIFDGVGPAGNVINVLSGNPIDCHVIGCINLTGNPYGACTIIGSI